MNKKLWMTAALALSLSSAEAVANTLEEGNLVAVCDNVGKFVSQRPKKSERWHRPSTCGCRNHRLRTHRLYRVSGGYK